MRRRAADDVVGRRLAFRVAGHLLSYPDEAWSEPLDRLRAATGQVVDDGVRAGLLAGLDHVSGSSLAVLQRDYVELFDLSRKHALYLSYWTDGDTRRRGEVLAGFKQRYRASGFVVDTHGELPDYLPLVLEYAAIADPDDGVAMLTEYRASIELLKFALRDVGTPYAEVVAAICATLPGASPVDAAEVHRMVASGPPVEAVGLEPYAGASMLPLVDARS